MRDAISPASLITGAKGFIGSALLAALQDKPVRRALRQPTPDVRRIEISNHLFPDARRYRRPEKKSSAVNRE